MIEKFKRLRKDTVRKFLQREGTAPQVYSMRFKGMGSLMPDNDVYLYASEDEVALVAIDAGKPGRPLDELADEEPFCGDAPMYFTESSHRVSPVWRMAMTCELLRRRIRSEAGHDLKMWGVVLTASNIINYDVMLPIWKDMQVSLLPQMGDLPNWSIPVNNDEDLMLSLPHLLFFARPAFSHDEVETVKKYFADRFQEKFAPEHTVIMPDNDEDDDEDDDDEEKKMLHEEFGKMLEKLADQPYEDEDSDDDDDDLSAPDGGETTDDADAKGDAGCSTLFDDSADDFDFDEPNPATAGLLPPEQPLRVKLLKPIKEPWAELDKMVGCADVKRNVRELMAFSRYNTMMRQLNPGGKQHTVSLHSLFFGRPGTGKTTVCKIYGSLLRQAGMLSSGHVVVCNRGTFVGNNWGDEEKNVWAVLKKARGGVLMIDEAYLLCSSHPNDPGRFVVPLLMDVLADERQRDIAVVLCGYKEQMKRLIEINPGLESRFPNRFDFHDFTVDELLTITQRRIKEYGYRFTRSAWAKYKTVVDNAYGVRDAETWGNARFVANLLEHIYVRHAQRCIKMKEPDTAAFCTITAADVETIDVPRQKSRIGF